MKTIALPIWGNRISPVFETTRRFLIVECSKGSIKKQLNYDFNSDLQLERVSKLIGFKVDVLLCGAISNMFVNMIQAYGIQVFPFLTGPVQEILDAYCRGTLFSPQYTMPGCRRKRRRRGCQRNR